MPDKSFNGVYFDFGGEIDGFFCFGVASDSPNEIMAARLAKLVEELKPFRLVVTDLLEHDEDS